MLNQQFKIRMGMYVQKIQNNKNGDVEKLDDVNYQNAFLSFNTIKLLVNESIYFQNQDYLIKIYVNPLNKDRKQRI